MIRKVLFGVGIVILSLGIYVVYLSLTTKSHSPAETASFESDSLSIEVNYSRPFMKGRLIFGTQKDGALVPYGQKWRTGANEATEITFSSDVTIADQSLKAGTYSIYTLPDEEEWIVVFSSKTRYWGASFSGEPYDEAYDVVRVKGTVSQLAASVEQFGISLQEESIGQIKMSFVWDLTQASILIKY